MRVELARDFSELRTGDHVLVLDNRVGQWLNRAENAYLQEPDWTRKQLALYHGWELPDGTVAWQLLYQGVVQRLSGMAHGWRQPHRVRLESQDGVAAGLKQKIGAPADTGERRPFLRGAYRARGELIRVVEASLGEISRTGSGSAGLNVLGTYRGDYLQDYLLEAETSGRGGRRHLPLVPGSGPELAEERGWRPPGPMIRWIWMRACRSTWEPGLGPDLVAGDRWTFPASPRSTTTRSLGPPLRPSPRSISTGKKTTTG